MGVQNYKQGKLMNGVGEAGLRAEGAAKMFEN